MCIVPLVAEQLHTYVYMFYFSYAFACIMNNLHGWLHVRSKVFYACKLTLGNIMIL